MICRYGSAQPTVAWAEPLRNSYRDALVRPCSWPTHCRRAVQLDPEIWGTNFRTAGMKNGAIQGPLGQTACTSVCPCFQLPVAALLDIDFKLIGSCIRSHVPRAALARFRLVSSRGGAKLKPSFRLSVPLQHHSRPFSIAPPARMYSMNLTSRLFDRALAVMTAVSVMCLKTDTRSMWAPSATPQASEELFTNGLSAMCQLTASNEMYIELWTEL